MEKPSGAKKVCYNEIDIPLVAIDELEELTGLDLFVNLPAMVGEDMAAKLEKRYMILWCKFLKGISDPQRFPVIRALCQEIVKPCFQGLAIGRKTEAVIAIRRSDRQILKAGKLREYVVSIGHDTLQL